MVLIYLVSLFLNIFIYKSEHDNISNFSIKPLKDIQVKDINGDIKLIGDYFKNKKALIFVNVASACGLTKSNYEQLVQLYNKYRDLGLEILAFPCNQFGQQERECEQKIKKFTEDNYKVEFPIFSKIDVNGENTHDIYVNLKNQIETNDKLYNIKWNFAKFLVDSEGKVVKYFDPHIEPFKIENDVLNLISKDKEL